MCNQIREDGFRMSNAASGSPRLVGASLAAAALSLMLAGPAAGQAAKDFRASVVDLSKTTQHLMVPLNRSVTVESTVEITRADVIAKQVADVQVISPTRILITGQNYGSTSVVLLGGDNKQYAFEVTVELDLERLNESLRGVDPQAKVQATSVRGHILLTGTVSSAVRAKRMVELAELFLPATGQGQVSTIQNHLEIGGEQQVLLHCIVAEMSRSASRELGINGFLAGENVRDAFVVNQLGGINPANIGAAANALVTENIPFLTGEDGIPLGPASTLSLGFPRVQMQFFIRAMADNGLVTILAEPNLVASSGESASFLAGGEFPYPVSQGNQQVTTEFREFGVQLSFTPVVIGHQRIQLRIEPAVSELDFSTATQIGGFPVPGLRKRSASTVVEVGAGQTLAIAGLLSEEVRSVASRIPGAGDIPVLGALFRSVNFRRQLTELVILVTPEMVAPLDAHQTVALPGQDRTNPNDFELYLLGMVDGAEREADASAASAPHGQKVGLRMQSEPDELSIHGPWGHSGLVGMR